MDFRSVSRRVGPVILLLFFGVIILPAQTWKPAWGRSVTTRHGSGEANVFCTDNLNNSYCGFSYADSIFFPDTVFFHPPSSSWQPGYAVAKYDQNGRFLKALDMYSVPDGGIWYEYAVTDHENNLYLCVEFQVRVFLLDTVINHGPGPYPQIPAIFLAKFDPDFHLKWVKMIYGTTQNDCWGLKISPDDHLYLSCSHYGSPSAPQTTYLLGQDTIQFNSTQLNTLIKTDLNGTIEWVKQISGNTYYNQSFDPLEIGEDQKIYTKGQCTGDVFVDSLTLHHPYEFHGKNSYVLLSFTQDGVLDSYRFHPVWFDELKVNAGGDIFFSSSIGDTLFLGQDTIVRHGDDTVTSLVGRMSPQFQPYWYHVLKKIPYINQIQFHLALKNDTLIFVTPADGIIWFLDSTYVTSYYQMIYTGQFDPAGNLTSQQFFHSTAEMIPSYKILDNCRDIVIGGLFRGKAILGPDTLVSFDSQLRDSFLTTIKRMDHSFDLGNDTVVCTGITLHAPPGLVLFNWNNGQSVEPDLPVTQTGLYRLAAADANNCWMEDSIYVHVVPEPVISLGNDTTIKKKDSLRLAIAGNYPHVIWSTGDTGSSIIVKGSLLGIGDHIFWVEVSNGPCSVTDSILVTVVKNPGISETTPQGPVIFPNPAADYVDIELSPDAQVVEISDVSGSILRSISLSGSPDKIRMDLKGLREGVYFITIRGTRSILSAKFIKL
jgi:hypothetical protein